jgi:hypothetical protein
MRFQVIRFKDRTDSAKFLNAAIKAAGTALLAAAIIPAASAQQAGQETFSSAGKATKALVSALQSDDESALLKILGPNAKKIISSGDPTEDKSNRKEFVQKYHQMHRLVDEPDGKTTLYIGAENWPTPIPLKQKNGAWYFDTAAGEKEILYRRIGRNELSAIQVCRELVDAEKEYYGQPHDGNSGNQYAQKLSSDSGKHNGLYWEVSAGEGESPIGPMLAAAAAEADSSEKKPDPFMGYYFRILTEEKVAGTIRNYIVDGKMTRGFAFIAYPAEYRVSGVMTFMVDQDGIVYEKDLGPRSETIAKKLTRYDRDTSWRKAD